MQSLLQRHNLARLTGVACLAFLMAAGCGEDDGLDGDTVMVEESEATDECDHGGTVFTSGYDETGDGEIDDVVDEYAVCEGAPGADGEDGASGEDGTDAKVQTSSVEPGSECDFGGVRVESGTDESGDGELSEDEIEHTEYVCNTQCATGAPLHFDIQGDDLPEQFVINQAYEASVETDADSAAVKAFNPSGDVEIDVSYDGDDQEMTFEHLDGLATTDLTLIITDGCDVTVDSVRLGPFEEGIVDLYVGHMAPEAGSVDVVSVGDDDDNDNADPVTSVSGFEMAGPVEIDWGQHQFELVDEDDEIVATTPEYDFEPFSEQLVYVYGEDDGVELDNEPVDTSEPAEDDYRIRATHGAEDVGELDMYSKDDEDETALLFEEMNFGETTDAGEFEADEDGILGFDSEDDGQLDLEFDDTVGMLAQGAILESFLVEHDGQEWLAVYDYVSGEMRLALDLSDFENREFPSSPDLNLPQGGDASDSVSVDDCGTVGAINMDIEAEHETGWYDTNFTVYLENPAGDEYPLWSEADEIDGDDVNMVGNFNNTIPPATGLSPYEPDVEPIDVFVGSGGDGDWTIRIHNDSCCTDGHLHFWQLNIACSGGDDDNGDDDNGDDDNGDDDNGDDDNGDD